jgi:hypothetical protein
MFAKRKKEGFNSPISANFPQLNQDASNEIWIIQDGQEEHYGREMNACMQAVW